MGRWIRIAIAVAIVLLPFGLHTLYKASIALPDTVRIATGPEGGRFRLVAEAIAAELASRAELEVQIVHTEGSVENLELLERGEVDFALYQQGTWETLGREPVDGVAFVARAYLEAVHVVVRADSGIERVEDLRGRIVDLGPRGSGDDSMSRILLAHFGVPAAEIEARHLSYTDASRGLSDGSLDAAILTTGVRSPLFPELFENGTCKLLPMPWSEALPLRHIFLTTFVIPAGSYGHHSHPVPAEDLVTVATAAQLLTRADASTNLVEEVAALLHDQSFLKRTALREIFQEGARFSREKPDYPLHVGARHFYEPETRTLLDPAFVDATESFRSFVVSFLIAGYLIYRWLRKRADRRDDHRLDRFIRALLEIERRQIDLDREPDVDDVEQLQDLLDELTRLRQEALATITAHQINEDRGADCFIEMCHALSNKINAKISRQRMDKVVRELRSTLERAGS